MSNRILIMGLPGSGKTILATALKNHVDDIKHNKIYVIEILQQMGLK
jgi:adenylate kinase family enzyme